MLVSGSARQKHPKSRINLVTLHTDRRSQITVYNHAVWDDQRRWEMGENQNSPKMNLSANQITSLYKFATSLYLYQWPQKTANNII